MPIQASRFFNDPNLGQAFANLSQAFAPPSGTDAAGWASANSENAKASRLAQLFAYARDPAYDQTTADRLGVLGGLYAPSQSYYSVDQGNATTRRGQDVGAASARYGTDRSFEASRANNADDNASALAQTGLQQTGETARSMLAPVGQGATRFVPPELAKLYGVSDMQIGAVSAGQGDRVALPDGRMIEGAAKLPSVDEVKAAALQSYQREGQIPQREMLAAILGDPKLAEVQGPEGPVYARAIDAVGQRPAIDVGKQGEVASKMRGEFVQLPAYKNYAQAAPIYSSMLETAGRNTKASDLNIVYSIGKLFDPTSVVREGEQIAVRNTASLPDWLQGAIAQLNGGSALTQETREALVAEGFTRMTAYEDALGVDINRYGEIADRAGVRRDDVLPKLERAKRYERPQKPTAARGAAGTVFPQPAPQSDDLPTPQTSADFDALPSGTRYRDPDDGKTYRKP